MIQFRYRPTFSGFWAMNFMVLVRQFRFLIWGAVMAVLMFLLLPLLAMVLPENPVAVQMGGVGPAILFVPGLVCFLFISTYFAAKRRWKVAAELREEQEYQIDEGAVRVRGETFNSSIQWNILKEASVSRGYFFLKTGQNAYFYFPIEAVPDVPAFVDLVRRKVPVLRKWPKA